jgi:acyl-CoA dehydrogenase
MTVVETALAGGVFAQRLDDDLSDIRNLVDEIGGRAFDARVGQRRRPERHDDALWQNLDDTGLARLTTVHGQDAGPAEAAVVLSGLARHCAAVAIAETDLLAAWLANEARLTVPANGPLTVVIADGDVRGGRISGTATDVPWTRTARKVILAARTPNCVHVGAVDPSELMVDDGINLAGEPRDRISFELPAGVLQPLGNEVYDELVRRGAWARCMQTLGALDAAAISSVTHCRNRVQFGQPLMKFQAVQHSLAAMAGQIERARTAATLAIAAAADHGFASAEADYAISVAKVVLGDAVVSVTTRAHQLHGAIGVSIEHPLWLATMRAQSWIAEFGTTRQHARRLGALVLNSADPWDCLIGRI